MSHSSTYPVVSTTLLACALLASAGCTQDRAASGDRGVVQPDALPTTPDPATPRRGSIATVTTTDNAILAELILAADSRGHALEAGMFFRVLADGGKTFKGLVQVTEVISPTRCIARQVGLTDRSRGLATDDRVAEVADLAALTAPDAVESAARNQQLRLDQLDGADRRLFEAVRANYQQALADTEARHKVALDELERKHREQLAAAETASRLAMERREAEARAAELATRAGLANAVETAIAEDRKAQAAKLETLVTERDQLRTQVDSLLVQQQQHATRIDALVQEQAERQRAQTAQLRAEVETREVLQARLDEVEAKLAGRPASTVTVLTADPQHPETVLERLARVTRELNAEREARRKLSADIDRFTATAGELRAENERLAARAVALAHADEKARELQEVVAESKRKLLAAEQSRDALELARLEAERRLFDLSARVLRLTDPAPATVALQARLRDSLGAQDDAKPATGTTP